MDGQRTDAPPKLSERGGSAAVAGACGAALAAAGCYTFLAGIVSQGSALMAGNAASVTIAVLFFLLLAVAMSAGGGAILSKALGVSTWQRSTLISAAAHAIGLPLWFWTYNQIVIGFATYGFDGLVAGGAAAYAFVVPLVVVFSSFRENALGGWAVAIALSAATATLPAAAVLVDSEELAVTSGVVAWVVHPAVSVLGLALIGPRNR